MANELVDVMREFGVEVRLLGAEEEPSPGGLAMADMLMEILRLRQLTSNLAYDALPGCMETEPAHPADAGGEDADKRMDWERFANWLSGLVPPYGRETASRIVQEAQKRGLVPRREPVVVTDDDVEDVQHALWGKGFSLDRARTRLALQAFADRLNGGER